VNDAEQARVLRIESTF